MSVSRQFSPFVSLSGMSLSGRLSPLPEPSAIDEMSETKGKSPPVTGHSPADRRGKTRSIRRTRRRPGVTTSPPLHYRGRYGRGDPSATLRDRAPLPVTATWAARRTPQPRARSVPLSGVPPVAMTPPLGVHPAPQTTAVSFVRWTPRTPQSYNSMNFNIFSDINAPISQRKPGKLRKDYNFGGQEKEPTE